MIQYITTIVKVTLFKLAVGIILMLIICGAMGLKHRQLLFPHWFQQIISKQFQMVIVLK